MLGAVTRRKRALEELESRRGRSTTYTLPLAQDDADLKAFITEFYKKIYRPETRIVQNETLEKYPDSLGMHYQILVPNVVPETDFWLRYFYRCDVNRICRELADMDAIESKKQIQDSMSMLHQLFSPQNREKARKKSSENLKAKRAPSPQVVASTPTPTTKKTTSQVAAPPVPAPSSEMPTPLLSDDTIHVVAENTTVANDAELITEKPHTIRSKASPKNRSLGLALAIITVAIACLTHTWNNQVWNTVVCAPVRPGTHFEVTSVPSMLLISPWWVPESMKEPVHEILCPYASVSLQWTAESKEGKLLVTRKGEHFMEIKRAISIDIDWNEIKVTKKRKVETFPLPWSIP